MKLYTAMQTRAVDTLAIKKIGIPSLVLMEHAAKGVLEELELRFCSLCAHRFVVLYGTGNNGGDALVVARMLLLKGAEVIIVEALAKPTSSDCEKEMKILLETDKFTRGLKKIKPEQVSKYIDDATIVIDGVFGTGFKRNSKVSPKIKKLFEVVSEAPYVVAIDVPSGVDVDTGVAEEWALTADLTVTFALPKVGLYVSPGAVHSGEVVVKDLYTFAGQEFTPYELLDENNVRNLFWHLCRKKESHKGSYGHVLIMSPELGFEGAITLCATAALKSGAGLVSIAAINENAQSLRKRMPKLPPEIMVKDFDIKTLNKYSVVVVGPGYGKKRKKELKEILKNVKGPLVLDADALNIISEDKELLSLVSKNKEAILTPHPGEMARLANVKDVQIQRLNVLKLFVMQHEVNVILKGYMSLVASREGKVFVNPTGNPGLSKGGSGDVLSGMIAAFCAQGLSVVDAGLLGTYIHGLCADMLVDDGVSVLTITPTDIIEEIGNALKCLTKSL
jgi:ADP-dependent NAD(P)H-hydrate dehydratase / NAD(P)H-hydrate epimerase